MNNTLENATDLLDTTIETLSHEQPNPPHEKGVSLLQQWIEVLSQSENTQPLGQKLAELNDTLAQDSPDTARVQNLLNEIADTTQEFAVEVGPEGELPSQLEGVAAALRTISNQLT
ncbi:hypothetical protein GCM10027347_25880 [Larkinella harenae]